MFVCVCGYMHIALENDATVQLVFSVSWSEVIHCLKHFARLFTLFSYAINQL